MSKFIIVLTCNDTDGGNFSDIVNGIYNTREEAEKVVKQSMQDELESLGDGYEISPYDEFTIQNVYEQNITTYTIFEIDTPKRYKYTITDCYDKNCVYGTLVFDHPLTYEEYAEIQRKIDELKEEYIENNGDLQYEDILDELHRYFDFEDEEVMGMVFEF